MREDIESLKQRMFQVARDAEHTDAKIAEINPLVRRINDLGIVPPQAFFGSASEEPADDHGVVVQTALLVPEGFGVVRVGTDEFSDQWQLDTILERDSRSYFVPYAQCSVGTRALIARDVSQLFEQFVRYVERWAIVPQA